MGILRRIICTAAVIAAVAAGAAGCAYTGGNCSFQAAASIKSGTSKELLEVHYIDVGQGDSTLIKCGGEAMLIDAGDDSQGTRIRLYLKKQGVTKLRYLVMTHPDSDHVGGAPSVIENIDIEKVYASDYSKDTRTYERVNDALKQEDLTPETPDPGDTAELGSAKITFIGPCGTYDDANDSSVSLKVTYGDRSFLFTGDAEEQAEYDMVSSGEDLHADVYKAGHHGSSTASSKRFLDKVNPSAAVISCGEGNKYGHPHAETLNRFRSMGLDVYRTDEQGTIVAETDGKKITWNTSPSTTWKAGEATGGSAKESYSGSDSGSESYSETVSESETGYVLNTNSMKFHRPDCKAVKKMKSSNRVDTDMTREEIISKGYKPCKICDP